MREQDADGTALGEMMDGEITARSVANAHGETLDRDIAASGEHEPHQEHDSAWVPATPISPPRPGESQPGFVFGTQYNQCPWMGKRSE